MYDNFIGKRLSKEEIFNSFAGMAVLGEPEPPEHITIEYIGSPEEMYEKRNALRKNGHHCCVFDGRPLRKGEGVIYNSRIKLDELVGKWNTSVTADGGMSNDTMVLKSDGKGIFGTANMGPYWVDPFTWYVEEDVLYINTKEANICGREIEYTPDVIVPCMSGKEKHFTKLEHGAWVGPYYREIADKTLLEWDQEALDACDWLMEHGIVW